MKSISDVLGRSRYGQKLTRPEWQNFAKGIRAARQNGCQICRRSDLVTQVHHFFYDFNREPWEYAANEVMLLCEYCHKAMHLELQNFRQFVFPFLTPQTFRVLNGTLRVALTELDGLTVIHAFGELVLTPSMVRRYAEAWGKRKMESTES